MPFALLADPSESPVEQVTSFANWARNIDWFDVAVRAGTAAVILLAAFLLVRIARRGVRRWVSRVTARGLQRTGGEARSMRFELRARTLGDVTSDAVAVVIWIVAVFTALGQIEIELGPLIAGAGIAGIALGFGAQSLVKDFLSGFFILLEDQYGIGDVVAIDEQGQVSGRVEDISMRVTRLRALDGTVWFVPNGEIRFLANRSKEWARALVDFEVAYGSGLDDAVAAITAVSAGLREDEEFGPKILEDVEILGVEVLGESGMTVRTFIKTLPLEQWKVARAFRRRVKEEFDRRGIEIPFPHRKLIIESGVPPAPGAAPPG